MKWIILSLSAAMGALYYMQANACFCGLWCDHSQSATAQLFVKEAVKSSLYLFNDSVGHYPTTEEGLAALYRAPKGTEARWHGPYAEGSRIPLDPWGHEYQYRSPALNSSAAYDLWSLGPDGVVSADDIGNWSK